MEVTMEKEVKLKTDEEKKAALEAALARVRPVVKANTEKDTPVMERLAKLAKAEPEKEQENGKKKDKKPLSLDELAKKQADLDKKAKENGVEPISKKNKKDDVIGKVDAVYFVKDWKTARGCRIERQICEAYGVKILEYNFIIQEEN